MEKFSKALNGYNPKEVNAFLDDVIGKIEQMVQNIKSKETEIAELKKELSSCTEHLNRYKDLELSLNKTILAAQDSGEQIRRIARREAEMVINDARNNANRIINDALMKAEKTEYEMQLMKRNTNVFKKRLKGILESQLELIDDIEVLEI